MAEITLIDVGDPSDLWRDLGFAVGDGRCAVGGTVIRLDAPGEGVTGWQVSGADGLTELPAAELPAGELPLTELPAGELPAGEALLAAPGGAGSPHPNGVEGLDHVVVTTPDLDRTIEAFERAGVQLRRTRDVPGRDRPVVQAFFKLGAVVVEVVGSPGRPGPGPARFYGLAFTVADLDATAERLGGRLRPARDAVQPGRRIATLDRSAGSSVPIAFMSAEQRGPRRP